MENKKYFYELTDYPKIFKKTYWGKFNTENREQKEMEEIKNIVQNRNQFIKDYNIKNICLRPIKKIYKFIDKVKNDSLIDHLEIYETNNKEYYILNSPYKNIDDEITIEFINLGWTFIPKLYFNESITFIIKVNFEMIKKTNQNYMKKYYENKGKKYIECDICKKSYQINHKSRHENSKIHKIINSYIKN